MIPQPIRTPDLVAQLDRVTLWVANLPAPEDVWSLRDAIKWAASHPERSRITLFRPPGPDERAVWLKSEQIDALLEITVRDAA